MRPYYKLMLDLQALIGVLGDPQAQLIREAEFCIKNYCEPWTCPDCGRTTKIPDDHKCPNLCGKCKNKGMMPYSYLEQHRMSWQINALLKCVQTYANKWFFGRLAKKVLADIHKVPKPKYNQDLNIRK